MSGIISLNTIRILTIAIKSLILIKCDLLWESFYDSSESSLGFYLTIHFFQMQHPGFSFTLLIKTELTFLVEHSFSQFLLFCIWDSKKVREMLF